VVTLADGGDAVSDLATLRDQPELFGRVCSTPTAWCILAEELPADPRGIAALGGSAGQVREQAWALSAAPAGIKDRARLDADKPQATRYARPSPCRDPAGEAPV